MKLNLEKNFKSLFKTKVSFTMAALTIFAITGGVSLAEDTPAGGTLNPQPPVGSLEENLDPNGNTNAIKEINKTNKRVNEHSDLIDRMGKAIIDLENKTQAGPTSGYTKTDMDAKLEKKADKAELEKKADKTELEKKADKTELEKKADKTELEKKADKTELEKKADKTELEKKADKTELEKKADKTELEKKADKTELEKKADKTELEKKADKDSVYTKKESDDKFMEKADVKDLEATNARVSANERAIKHLDSKLNKTTAMMTAMNNVDFQDVNAGEVAIGAGVGHFVGDQAVAVGVAYGVNDDLKVHAKWSGVAGDPHYNAIGGGVTYKFRTR